MPKDRERSAQATTVRFPLASGFLPALTCGLRRGRAAILPLRGGDPVDDILVLLDFPEDFHLRTGTEFVERFDHLQNPRL